MTANPVADLLAAPLSPNWTIEGLAEQLLCTIAIQPENEFSLDATALTDRQSRRLIRPLFACLANMSGEESGTSDDIFGADLSFQRSSADGPVWIFGRFENTQAHVRIFLEKSSSPPKVPSPSLKDRNGVENLKRKQLASPGSGDDGGET